MVQANPDIGSVTVSEKEITQKHNSLASALQGKAVISNGNFYAREGAKALYAKKREQDVDAQLTQLLREQQDTYDSYYAPLIDDLSQDAQSNRILDRARLESKRMPERTQAQVKRSLGMRGEKLTAAQRRGLDRSVSSSISKGQASTMNMGRLDQRNYRDAVTNDIMAVGSALQNNSTDALSNIARARTQRELEYNNAKRGFKSNLLGTIGAATGAVFGGPVGAGIGGAIGTTLGGGG